MDREQQIEGTKKGGRKYMIYIIRHGQTEQNNRKLLTGRANYQLNETGISQAREAGAWIQENGIHFDIVFSSPLDRALDTAALAAPGVEMRVDERLIEMEFGPYEGMDLTWPAPEVITFFRDFEHNPAPEGMEPLKEVTARLGALLEELKPLAKEKNILLSTHAIAMKGALSWLTPPGRGSWWSRYIENCAIYQTELKDGEYTEPVQVR